MAALIGRADVHGKRSGICIKVILYKEGIRRDFVSQQIRRKGRHGFGKLRLCNTSEMTLGRVLWGLIWAYFLTLSDHGKEDL